MAVSHETLVSLPQAEALGSRYHLEVIPAPQRPFEVTGAVFLLQKGIDAASPQNGSQEHRGAFITRYSNGPDTIYLIGSEGGGQAVLEAHAQTVWSQKRRLSQLESSAVNRMRQAYKDTSDPLHEKAVGFAGEFFRQEEHQWLFEEAISQGNTGRVPEVSITAVSNAYGHQRDREDVQRIVDAAWENVFADDEARKKRLEQEEMQKSHYPYTEAAKSKV